MSDRNEQARQRFAMAAVAHDALNNAVRALADKTNELTMLVMALCKKLGTTPTELIALLTPEDFINPDDNKHIEPADDSGTKLVS